MLKKYWLFATSMIIISLVTVFSFYNVLTPEKKLPIYQPSMVKFQLVDSTIQHVKRFHKIDDFKLLYYSLFVVILLSISSLLFSFINNIYCF